MDVNIVDSKWNGWPVQVLAGYCLWSQWSSQNTAVPQRQWLASFRSVHPSTSVHHDTVTLLSTTFTVHVSRHTHIPTYNTVHRLKTCLLNAYDKNDNINKYNIIVFWSKIRPNAVIDDVSAWCRSHHHHTTTTAVLRPFFRDHPGELVPEENFWTLWCKGRLTDANTLTIWLYYHNHHTPQPFYGPFSRTTWVSWCQKRTSGLYGARGD